MRSAQGSGAPWGAQQCVEITMAANGVMTLVWADGRPASVGRMEHLAALGEALGIPGPGPLAQVIDAAL